MRRRRMCPIDASLGVSLNSTRTTMARQSCQHVPTEIEYLFTRLARDTVFFLYRSALVQFVEDAGRARLGL